ncbi:hypothetical protein Taro_012150 [Colocasia esculenta]|uniref:Helicase-associated domain-containing protein n=1 Tax=Colocasia esculenta TaxID=4460 RepID=A0A843U893_COLES|nr:hypothetical protein [Colocasia esculenta]
MRSSGAPHRRWTLPVIGEEVGSDEGEPSWSMEDGSGSELELERPMEIRRLCGWSPSPTSAELTRNSPNELVSTLLIAIRCIISSHVSALWHWEERESERGCRSYRVAYRWGGGMATARRLGREIKMSSIIEDWISRANAKQRRGRAGRVKPGMCFCLYTHHRFEKVMRSFQVPEMLRVPLTELCLQIKSLALGGIKSFLLKAIEPPREDAISSAISTLYEVGAIESDEIMTPLGYHLAKLPVDVPIGKMLLYGAIFGCLSPILSIASCLSYKSPFVYPKDEKENVERAKLMLLTGKVGGTDGDEGGKQSDHLLVALAYSRWAKILHEEGTKAANHLCRSFFLSSSVMYTIRDMRIQFGDLLADIGLVNLPTRVSIFVEQRDRKMKDKLDRWFADASQPFNMYSHHSSIVKAIVCAGLYPNVAATEEGIAGPAQGSTRSSSSGIAIKEQPLWFDGRREVHIHPSSVNSSVKEFRHPFLVFLEKSV